MRGRRFQPGRACAVLGLLLGTACAASWPTASRVLRPDGPPTETQPSATARLVVSGGTEVPDEECWVELPAPRPFVGRPVPWRVSGLRFGPARRWEYLGREGCFGDTVPAEHIKERLGWNRGRILHCYVAALQRDRTVAGRIVVAFTVDRAGEVSDVEVESDTSIDELLSQCIGDVVAGLRFICSTGSVRVRYPVVLQPGPHVSGMRQ